MRRSGTAPGSLPESPAVSERFYFPELAEGNDIEIGGPEAHHMLRVMRLGPGAAVELFDGLGNKATATIVSTARSTLVVRIGVVVEETLELAVRLVVAAPLPKGDRARFLIEKLTELGAARYVPLETARSVVHGTESTADRLRKYVIEASKQCGRNRLMAVDPSTPLADYIAAEKDAGTRLVLDPMAESPLDATEIAGQVAVAVCVGPEGGWTPAELELLGAAAFLPRSLGKRVLRTETAAIAAASFVATCAESRTATG
jgi:16S rRNA (uracil1498-N3)-methyltransferase